MAFFFSLAIECDEEAPARACAEHFATGDVPVDASVQRSSEDGAWWAVVVPRDESTGGVTAAVVAESLTRAGRALLERLRSAPPYRFAVIGVEAFEAITYEDLNTATGSDPSFPERFDGLVVSDAVAANLGAGAPLEAFAPGYVWFPYRGERYE